MRQDLVITFKYQSGIEALGEFFDGVSQTANSPSVFLNDFTLVLKPSRYVKEVLYNYSQVRFVWNLIVLVLLIHKRILDLV